ncbi:hypothetical protein P8452_58745 [Trifolium repens]|nr:hypothetical protein P8452_58745 [Trifolium repens]
MSIISSGKLNFLQFTLFQFDSMSGRELLQEIEPYGNEFNPSSAVRYLTAAIKSKFDWFCPTWGHATKTMRDFWFDEFKKYCTWQPKYEARSSMHTGGSISMGEHERRMEEATGVKPTMEEVFAKCHLEKDKSWVDTRAKKAFHKNGVFCSFSKSVDGFVCRLGVFPKACC